MQEKQRKALERDINRLIAYNGEFEPLTVAYVGMQSRKIARQFSTKVVLALVQHRHARRRRKGLVTARGFLWLQAERSLLEVILEEQPGWRLYSWLYRPTVDRLSVRGSRLLSLGQRELSRQTVRRQLVYAICYGELMSIYRLEPEVYTSLEQKRALLLSWLALRVQDGSDLN